MREAFRMPVVVEEAEDERGTELRSRRSENFLYFARSSGN
jgi:hypothetical protein